MNRFSFEFEQSPWEATAALLRSGDTLSAVRFLTLLEGEEESFVEEAFADMEGMGISLSIEELPRDYGCGETEKRLRREEHLVKKGNLLLDLEENDPLRLYLEELAGVPAAGDAQLLAQQYLDGDSQVVQMLVNLCITRVIEAAKTMTGRGVLLLDLIQEGSLGLWQGILNYTGGEFEPHIDWWIRQYLAKAVTLQARENGVGMKMRKALEAYREADKRLLTQLGRNPTVEEIALDMQISPEDAEVYQDMLRTAQLMEQVKKPRQTDEIEDERAVEDTAYFQSRQRIQEMLSELTQQEAAVLTLRFGLEDGQPCTPQQVGTRLDLTAEQVVALEAAALAKLRK